MSRELKGNKLSLLTAILALLTHVGATAGVRWNPGLIAKFPKASLYPVTVLALPTINPLISHLEIDRRFDMGIITLKGFDLDIQPLKPSQIKYDFDKNLNSFDTCVTDIAFSFRAPVDIAVWVFKSKGWIRATGIIKKIQFTTASGAFTDKQANKPFVHLTFQTIELNPDDLDIHADIDWVPDFIMNQIMNYIKSNVVESVRKTILEWLNQNLTQNINEKINEGYPANLRIGDTEFALQTALTDPLYFDRNGIFFPLDGTIFLAARGYQRHEDSQPMAVGDPWNHTFEFYFSEYSARTFFEVIAKQLYDFKVTDFMASVTTFDEKVDLTIHEKGMLLKGIRSKERVESRGNHLEIESTFTSYLRPWITKDADGFVLNLEVTEGKIHQFKMNTSYPGLAALSDQFGSYLEGYFKAYPTCSMPMPDLDLFGYKWKDWNIAARANHFRIGITI